MLESLKKFLDDREGFRSHAIENMKHGHLLRDEHSVLSTDGGLTFAQTTSGFTGIRND